ncbi:MAG: hypothetical protein U5N26_11655 [Candidatus Marinimicrobia bacterium]|nr:hypothetical protein [Candidatus Neomarinimicrobiota bacterium]
MKIEKRVPAVGAGTKKQEKIRRKTEKKRRYKMMLVKHNSPLARPSRFYNTMLDDFFNDPFFNTEPSEAVHWAPGLK